MKGGLYWELKYLNDYPRANNNFGQRGRKEKNLPLKILHKNSIQAKQNLLIAFTLWSMVEKSRHTLVTSW